jgi:hypothetical protein
MLRVMISHEHREAVLAGAWKHLLETVGAVDRWTAISLKIIAESGKIGVRIRARKPM